MLKVQKFSLFQRCGMDSGQSQWRIVCSSQGGLCESKKEDLLKSAEDIVIQLGHSKRNSEIKIIYGSTNYNNYNSSPPDALAAWITNWTGGTDVSNFRQRSARRPHPGSGEQIIMLTIPLGVLASSFFNSKLREQPWTNQKLLNHTPLLPPGVHSCTVKSERLLLAATVRRRRWCQLLLLLLRGYGGRRHWRVTVLWRGN